MFLGHFQVGREPALPGPSWHVSGKPTPALGSDLALAMRPFLSAWKRVGNPGQLPRGLHGDGLGPLWPSAGSWELSVSGQLS